MHAMKYKASHRVDLVLYVEGLDCRKSKSHVAKITTHHSSCLGLPCVPISLGNFTRSENQLQNKVQIFVCSSLAKS